MKTSAQAETINAGRSIGPRAFHIFHATKPSAYGTARNAVYFTA